VAMRSGMESMEKRLVEYCKVLENMKELKVE
jgi:hypothetical protein